MSETKIVTQRAVTIYYCIDPICTIAGRNRSLDSGCCRKKGDLGLGLFPDYQSAPSSLSHTGEEPFVVRVKIALGGRYLFGGRLSEGLVDSLVGF